mgnify:CR=1 FL=1
MTTSTVSGPQVTALNVTGMSCGHCVKGVSAALAAVAGVTRVVDVNLARGEAIVEGTATPAALIAAVVEDGYQATVRSAGVGDTTRTPAAGGA